MTTGPVANCYVTMWVLSMCDRKYIFTKKNAKFTFKRSTIHIYIRKCMEISWGPCWGKGQESWKVSACLLS